MISGLRLHEAFLWHYGKRFCCVVVLITAVGAAAGQSSAAGTPDDLASRLRAAASAQQSNDPAAVATANASLAALALREMADLRASLGLYSSAVELCRRSLALEDSVATRLSMAIAQTRAGLLDEAVAGTQGIVAADSGNAAAWNLQGKIWMMKGDYARAAESLGHSLNLQNDAEVAYTMAIALLKSNQRDKAARVFEKLQAAAGESAQGHILFGRAYESGGLNREAEEEYKKAIALDAKSSRGNYFLGLLYLEESGWDPTPDARQAFEREAALNPGDFFGNYFLGYLASQDKNYEESDRFLKQAAAAQPDWPEPYLYMGLNAYGAGARARAEELLREAIRLTSGDEARNNYQIRRAYFALGRILLIRGEKDEGTRLLNRSREIETSLVVKSREKALDTERAAPGTQLPAGGLTGGSRVAEEKLDAADTIPGSVWNAASLSATERARLQDTERQLRSILANAYNDLGSSEARRKDYRSALVHFKNGEEWDADAPSLRHNLALAAFLSGSYADSARVLRLVVAENPSDTRSISMLAMSLFSLQKYAEASEMFERAPDAVLADPRMAYGWAFSLARANQPQRAATVLDKLVELPVPPEMLVMAGKLYREIGEAKRATACFQKAREQDPNVIIPE